MIKKSSRSIWLGILKKVDCTRMFLHKFAFFNSKKCLVHPGEELGILWPDGLSLDN